MKLITVLFLVAGAQSAFASCPSVDQTVKKVEVGQALPIDVVTALECRLAESSFSESLCQTRVGIKKDILNYTKARLDVGEVTRQDVEAAEKDLANTESRCSN